MNTAVAGVDFIQVDPARQFEFEPFTLAHAWFFYAQERCRKLGQDVRRVQYIANNWFRLMGEDSQPGTWKRATVDRYTDARLAEGVKPTTVKHELTMMRACLSHNLKWERLDKVPHFEKPAGESEKRRPLTVEEFRRVMAQPMLARTRMFLIVAFWTGHRSRAIETLPWSRVDLEAGIINFVDPAMRKTNKRRNEAFPIPDELLIRLESAYARRKDDLVIGRGPRGVASTTYREVKAVLRAAGINERGIARHTLRKAFVTERIKAGADMEKVAALIADNAGTARKHYLTLLADDLRGVANLRAA